MELEKGNTYPQRNKYQNTKKTQWAIIIQPPLTVFFSLLYSSAHLSSENNSFLKMENEPETITATEITTKIATATTTTTTATKIIKQKKTKKLSKINDLLAK